MNNPTQTERQPEVAIWHYKGLDVPIEIRSSQSPEEEDQFLNAIADFLWKHRHACENDTQMGAFQND